VSGDGWLIDPATGTSVQLPSLTAYRQQVNQS
jgi:hypothetical protein